MPDEHDRQTPPESLTLTGAPQPPGYPAYHWCPFSDCLHSCLTCLGEDVAYDFLLGVTGSAWRLRWHADRWDLGNVGIMHTAEEAAAPFARAFEAVGYGHEVVARTAWAVSHDMAAGDDDEDAWRDRVVASIAAGRPAVALGVVGPPEPCVIAGYDGLGETLIGWSLFQHQAEDFPEQDFDEAGRFRKRDWFANTHVLILIGEKGQRPPLAQTYRRALEWLVTVARTPRVREHLAGPAAYDAWADAMVRDEGFPEDLGILRERLLTIHDAMCMVNQRQRAGEAFLREVAETLPALADDLHAAAASYDQENGVLGKIHEAMGGYVPPHDKARLPILRDPAVRAKVADVIRQARGRDIEAVEHVEKALAK